MKNKICGHCYQQFLSVEDLRAHLEVIAEDLENELDIIQEQLDELEENE